MFTSSTSSQRIRVHPPAPTNVSNMFSLTKSNSITVITELTYSNFGVVAVAWCTSCSAQHNTTPIQANISTYAGVLEWITLATHHNIYWLDYVISMWLTVYLCTQKMDKVGICWWKKGSTAPLVVKNTDVHWSFFPFANVGFEYELLFTRLCIEMVQFFCYFPAALILSQRGSVQEIFSSW